MKLRIAHTNGSRQRFYILEDLTETLSRPIFPGKTFKTSEAAEKALKEYIDATEGRR